MRTIWIMLLCAAAVMAADESSSRRAPGFALPDSRLAVYDLADYRGKVVIINFTKTDCPHCATFAEVLGGVQQKYGDKVVILAVVNGQHDNQDTVAKYVSGHGITYPVLFDCYQMAYSYFLKQQFETPSAYLVDGRGMIRGNWEYGPFTRDIFEGNGLAKEIDRLLGAGSGKK